MLPLKRNELDVRAMRQSVTWAPLFGYHQYSKFAATVAGCVGTIGADCAPGFIEFFSSYFQQLADTVLRSISDGLLLQVAAYRNAADTLQGLAGAAPINLLPSSGSVMHSAAA
jgi:hypothetical protein